MSFFVPTRSLLKKFSRVEKQINFVKKVRNLIAAFYVCSCGNNSRSSNNFNSTDCNNSRNSSNFNSSDCNNSRSSNNFNSSNCNNSISVDNERFGGFQFQTNDKKFFPFSATKNVCPRMLRRVVIEAAAHPL